MRRSIHFSLAFMLALLGGAGCSTQKKIRDTSWRRTPSSDVLPDAPLFCPMPNPQISSALSKLKQSNPLRIRMGMRDAPLSDETSFIPNPIETFQIHLGSQLGWKESQLPKAIQTHFSAWHEHAGAAASRTLTFSMPIAIPSAPELADRTLQWTVEQAHDQIPALFPNEIWIQTPNEGSMHYSRVDGALQCDEDAWQGQQPGTAFPPSPEVSATNPRKLPETMTEHYVGAGRSPDRLEIEIESRSTFPDSLVGPRFFQVDRVKIHGLFHGALDRPLEVTEPFRAVYVPGRFNLGWQYAIDLWGASDLEPGELAIFQEKEVRYLLIFKSGGILGTLSKAHGKLLDPQGKPSPDGDLGALKSL